MTRDEIALKIFCAMISVKGTEIDLYPSLGAKQMILSFSMADTFIKISNDL